MSKSTKGAAPTVDIVGSENENCGIGSWAAGDSLCRRVMTVLRFEQTALHSLELAKTNIISENSLALGCRYIYIYNEGLASVALSAINPLTITEQAPRRNHHAWRKKEAREKGRSLWCQVCQGYASPHISPSSSTLSAIVATLLPSSFSFLFLSSRVTSRLSVIGVRGVKGM